MIQPFQNMDFKDVFAQRLRALLDIVLNQSLDGIYFRTLRWTNFLVESVVYMTIRQISHTEEVLFAISKISTSLQLIVDILKKYMKDSENKKLFETKQVWENYCSQLFGLFEGIPKFIENELKWELLNGSIYRVQKLIDTVDAEKDRVIYDEALLHSYLDASRQMILVDDISLAIHNQLTAFHEESRFDRVTLHKELKAGLDIAFNALTSLLEKPRTAPALVAKTPTGSSRITTKIDTKLPKKIASPRETGVKSPRRVATKPQSASAKSSDKNKPSTTTKTTVKGNTVSIPTKPFSETKIPRYSPTKPAVSTPDSRPSSVNSVEIRPSLTNTKLPRRVGSPNVKSPGTRTTPLPFLSLPLLPSSIDDRLHPLVHIHEVYPPVESSEWSTTTPTKEFTSGIASSPVHTMSSLFSTSPSLQITAVINGFYYPEKWFAVYAYLHTPVQSALSAIPTAPSSVNMMHPALFIDVGNEDPVSKSPVPIQSMLPKGAEVMVVAVLDQETHLQGGKVSPASQLLRWEGEFENAVLGEQFFVYIPKMHSDTAMGSVSLAIQYYYQGALIGEVKQALMKMTSPHSEVSNKTTPISGMISRSSVNKKILLLCDDSDKVAVEEIQFALRASFSASLVAHDLHEDAPQHNTHSRPTIQALPMTWTTLLTQLQNGSSTHRQILDACDALQIYLSAAFFASPNVDQVFEFLAQQSTSRTKKASVVFFSTEALKIPNRYKSAISHFTAIPLPSNPLETNNEERMQKLTLKALQTFSNDDFPLYCYVFENKPKFAQTNDHASNKKTEVVTHPLQWKSLFVTEEKTKKLLGKKTYHVGFFCEDVICVHHHQLPSEPLTLTTSPDQFLSIRPYFQVLNRIVEAAQSAAPTPCAVPALSTDLFGSPDIGYASIPSLPEEFEAKDDAIVATKQAILSIAISQWKKLLSTIFPGHQLNKESTGLRRIINPANGKVKWVCSNCYETRWKELEQVSFAPTPTSVLALTQKLKKPSSTAAAEFAQKQQQEIQHLITFMYPSSSYETHPEHILSLFQREGIVSAKHLLFLDYLWKMEYDYDQVSSILTSLRSTTGTGGGWTVQQIRQLIAWTQKERAVIEDTSLQTQRAFCQALLQHLKALQEATETLQQGPSRLLCLQHTQDERKQDENYEKLIYMQQKYAFLEHLLDQ